MRLLTLSLGLTQFASAAGSRKVVHIGPIARAVADPDRLAEAEEVEAPLEPLDLQDQRERHLQRSGDAEESPGQRWRQPLPGEREGRTSLNANWNFNRQEIERIKWYALRR